MENAMLERQVQEFFAQERRKRLFVAFLGKNDIAELGADIGNQILKSADEAADDEKNNIESKRFDSELSNRVAIAHATLGLSELVRWGLRKRKSQQWRNDNVKLLLEAYLETAMRLRLLQEPSGGFELRTVYAGHPYSASVYTPVARFHELLFKEKAREIVRICSALGARELNIIYTRQEEKSGKGKIVLSIPLFNGLTKAKGSTDLDLENKEGQEIWHQAVYTPTHKPCLPPANELIWYDTEPQWKQLVEDRMKYGLSSIDLKITSQQDYQVNGEILADLSDIGLSIGGKWIEHTNLSLTVKGEFVPLDALPS